MRSRASRRVPARLALGLATSLCAAALATVQPLPARAAGRPAQLNVIPFPGTPDASPGSEIIFSSLTPSEVKSVSVRGAQSGPHAGRLVAQPDGAGTAFVPAESFAPGELVRVHAFLSSPAAGTASGDPGATRLSFFFRVAVPANTATMASANPLMATFARGHVPSQSFRSEPTLHPPQIRVSHDPDPRAGDILFIPSHARQRGLMIVNGQGKLVWFNRIHHRAAFNLEVQHYRGHPVLTWWQGKFVGIGYGAQGRDVIMNRSYRVVKILHAGNGYSSDLHEFQLTRRGTALVDAYVPVTADESSVGGPTSATVMDCVVQELDVKTGRLLWEWHALGHVPLSASYSSPGSPYDYFHLNSIQQLPDGNLLISARDTWAVYEISRRTGRVIWTLGGKDSSFRMGRGTNFEWQHDAHLRRHVLTLFDDAWDGLRGHQEERQSSALALRIDPSSRTARLLHRYKHSPPLLASAEGSAELLPDGNLFVGWGSQSSFSEYARSGRQIWDGRFPAGVASYRTYRFPWTGRPVTPPSLAISPAAGGAVRLYASWNGATLLAAWRPVGGASPSTLSPLAPATRWQGFETATSVRSEPRYLAVQALGSGGRVLGTSRPRPDPGHLAIFGSSAFVSTAGGGGELPVGCIADHRCAIRLRLASGHSLLATAAPSAVGSRRGALIPFRLSASGQRTLQRAPRHRLAVRASIDGASGGGASLRITLIPYSVSGQPPPESLSPSPTVQLVGAKDFVSSSTGEGGLLAACSASAECHVRATVTGMGQVIATTPVENLGADELRGLYVKLNPTGRRMLAQASGNQLGARVVLTNGGATARGDIALIGYR